MNKLIFLFIFISVNLFAVPIIKNPELANAATNAESAYSNKDYYLAAKYCLEIFNLKNAESQKELKKLKSDDNFSYDIRLHLIYLDSLVHTGQSAFDLYKNECEKIIAKYKGQEKDKNLSNLVWVYNHLARYYRSSYNKKMETQTLKKAAELFPESYLPVRYVKNIMNNSPEPLPDNIISEVKRIFNKNKELNNNKLTSAMACCNVILLDKTNGDAYSGAISFFESYTDADCIDLINTIKIVRNNISFDKPEQIKKYYDMLTILAVKQPNDKSRFKVIGFIINEKNKLENMMPELESQFSSNVRFEVKKTFNKNTLTSKPAFCNVNLLDQTGSNAFPAAVNFLMSYSDADCMDIIDVIKIARKNISFDKPEQVKKYYDMLTILAIKQPNDKSRFKVIGFIINEKNKIEAIIPKLRK
ncbi:MAG: hypothetical protein DRI94_14525 [Bacteroidetes bacterium]|nr:MAG: hypothetical protein DRI94_14525 [Bacteroidota bacterium]